MSRHILSLDERVSISFSLPTGLCGHASSRGYQNSLFGISPSKTRPSGVFELDPR
jgi:hypothetical protein